MEEDEISLKEQILSLPLTDLIIPKNAKTMKPLKIDKVKRKNIIDNNCANYFMKNSILNYCLNNYLLLQDWQCSKEGNLEELQNYSKKLPSLINYTKVNSQNQNKPLSNNKRKLKIVK